MAPSLSFRPADGSMIIKGHPLIIGPGLPLETVQAGLVPFYRSHVDHGNGYQWLTFAGVEFGGHPCGFSLCFHLGRLTRVHWGVALPDEKVEGGWPTREAIDEEISFVRGILAQAFGRSFATGLERFPWGTAWSVFDAKGFQASAGLCYDA